MALRKVVKRTARNTNRFGLTEHGLKTAMKIAREEGIPFEEAVCLVKRYIREHEHVCPDW